MVDLADSTDEEKEEDEDEDVLALIRSSVAAAEAADDGSEAGAGDANAAPDAQEMPEETRGEGGCLICDFQ